MARRDKMPWAPWNDSWKWGNPENWATKDTVDDWVAHDPHADGHVVLLERETDPYTDDPDPYAFVDGDDVRCPDTAIRVRRVADAVSVTRDSELSTSGPSVVYR